MRLRRGRRNTYCNRRPQLTTTTTTATKAGSRYPGARKSAKKFDSFIPLLRRRNTEDFIIADRTSEKTRWSEMEGRRRGSVERKALLGRNTCGYANTRSRAIWEEWDMHLGECRYPALRGLQVARKDWSNPRISSLVFHEIGRNRSRRRVGWR